MPPTSCGCWPRTSWGWAWSTRCWTSPWGGAHRDFDAAAESVREGLQGALSELSGLSADELREQRYAKFRAMGQFENGN